MSTIQTPNEFLKINGRQKNLVLACFWRILKPGQIFPTWRKHMEIPHQASRKIINENLFRRLDEGKKIPIENYTRVSYANLTFPTIEEMNTT